MNQLLHAVNFFLLRREEKRLCKSLENNSGINQLLHAVDFLLLRREEKRLCKSLENNSGINQFLHAVGALFFLFFLLLSVNATVAR